MSCGSSHSLASETYQRCCNGGSTCTSSNTYGWTRFVVCKNNYGDMVFDTSNPEDCMNKITAGLTNNFLAQRWCKSEGMDGCWLPYSVQSDGSCFPYGSMQWDSTSWDAKSKLGGSEILLNGAGPIVGLAEVGAPTSTTQTNIKSGPIGATAGAGLACVVGISMFLNKKQKRSNKSAGVEMKDGQLHAVRTV